MSKHNREKRLRKKVTKKIEAVKANASPAAKPSLPDKPAPPDKPPSALPVKFEMPREGTQHTQPCSECPFARGVTDEVLIKGGSPPEVYIGQAWGPFLLSCHMDPEYSGQCATLQTLQCPGAAIFRANCDRAKLMPGSMLKCPSDTEKVFANPAELLAHHRHIPLEEAEERLKQTSPDDLLKFEFARAAQSRKASIIASPKKDTP